MLGRNGVCSRNVHLRLLQGIIGVVMCVSCSIPYLLHSSHSVLLHVLIVWFMALCGG